MRLTRLLLALTVAILTAPVLADSPRGRLLNAVQPGRVVEVSATVGMLDNSRAWAGQAAQDAVERVQTVEVEFRANDRIQPWTWDWVKNVPRTDVTPLVFSVAVKEAWEVEGAPVEYNRYNVLACYDVGLAELYHCRQYQGSSGDEYLSSHINSIAMWRDDGDALVTALFTEDKGMELNIWSESSEWLEIVYNVLLLVIPALAGLAATSVFGAGLIRSIKLFWREWLRPALDDPTDPLVKLIAERTGRKPEDVSKWLTERIDEVIGVLPDEGQPLAEKKISEVS